MGNFVGRDHQLAELSEHLDRVRSAVGSARPGRCVTLRGRRSVGKSTLVETFAERAGVPLLFSTASRSGIRELALFARAGLESSLPDAALFAGQKPADWDAAFRLLASALADEAPAIVVLDEVPYLAAEDPSFEGSLQKAWDRLLSRKPVLLLLVGSDLPMIAALSTYDRPFSGRGIEMVLPPLTPVEAANLIGVHDPAAALDAYLVTGGLPLLCDEWSKGWDLRDFLRHQLSRPTSPLIVSAERVLAAEFPADLQAATILSIIGTGERTFSAIQRVAGIQATSLTRSLDLLTTKGIVVRELPLSTTSSTSARYRIADPYLRFWLTFIGPHRHEIERGRDDRVLARIADRWSTWRGKAIEPLVRDALARLLPIAGIDARVVGSYWTRTNDVEVDLVGADTSPIANSLQFTGSIEWRDRAPFSADDIGRLQRASRGVPGWRDGLPAVGVSRSGFDATPDLAIGPADLLAAWEP